MVEQLSKLSLEELRKILKENLNKAETQFLVNAEAVAVDK